MKVAKGLFPETRAYFLYAHVHCCTVFTNKNSLLPRPWLQLANPLESNISKFQNDDGKGTMAHSTRLVISLTNLLCSTRLQKLLCNEIAS